MRTLLGLAVVLVACGASDDDSGEANDAVSVGADWVRVEASCGFSFHAPPGVMEKDVQGIDSCVNEWSTSSCVYRGDYGAFSSDLTEYQGLSEYREAAKTIDGRSAKLVTARSASAFIAAAQFPEVGGGSPGTRLTVWAECEDKAGQLDAMAAWESLTFNP